MKDNRSIYCISSYIPYDEDIVVTTLYKLVRVGSDDNNCRYYWFCVNNTHGIGTSVKLEDSGSVDVEDAILHMFKFVDDRYEFIRTDDFKR
jgi:hypothetical protein